MGGSTVAFIVGFIVGPKHGPRVGSHFERYAVLVQVRPYGQAMLLRRPLFLRDSRRKRIVISVPRAPPRPAGQTARQPITCAV